MNRAAIYVKAIDAALVELRDMHATGQAAVVKRQVMAGLGLLRIVLVPMAQAEEQKPEGGDDPQ